METKHVEATSGFRLPREGKTPVQQDDVGIPFASRRAAGIERILNPDFRMIDASWLDGSFYKGEGNATLVVTLPRERKVLRFRKSDAKNGDEPAEDGGKSRVWLIVVFYKNIISGLLGSYASEPEIVCFHKEDLSRCMTKFEAFRPENRRSKKVVETFATTLPDYTLMPEHLQSHEKTSTFCVEIKPKQGFVDISQLRGKCDYCRKQCLKVAEGKISTPSSYCPCDLFSGQIDRMSRALRGLVCSPQNNFRIFRDGELVYGDGFGTKKLENVLADWIYGDKPFEIEKALDRMFELICDALLRPFPVDQRSPASNKSLTNSLPVNSVLDKILRVQRLNNHSVETVYRIYSTHSKILDDEMIYTKSKLLQNDKLETMPSEEELIILRNYLLSRVARDCSILISFQEIDMSSVCIAPSENVIRTSTTRCFLFNNAVTDLDPKSVRGIEKHYHQKTSGILHETEIRQSSE